MRQSATDRTVRRTVHPHETPLKDTRLRLHLPRQLARHELRAWDGLIESLDAFDGATEGDPPPRKRGA